LNTGRFDPLEIVQAFNRLGVEYVVIGGYAGELHAAAVPPTRDIDFTRRVTPENLGRLSQALTDLGAGIRTEGVPEGLPFSHDAASLAGVGIWNLTCEFGEFDISFMPSGTDGYEDLGAHSPAGGGARRADAGRLSGKTSSGPNKPPPGPRTSQPSLRFRNGSSHNRAPPLVNRQPPWHGGLRNA